MHAAAGHYLDPSYASILPALGTCRMPPVTAQPLDRTILLGSELPGGIVLSAPFQPPEHSAGGQSESDDPSIWTSGALAEAEPRAQATCLSPVGLAWSAPYGVVDNRGLAAGVVSADSVSIGTVLEAARSYHDGVMTWDKYIPVLMAALMQQ
jgi:hypothetical protein